MEDTIDARTRLRQRIDSEYDHAIDEARDRRDIGLALALQVDRQRELSFWGFGPGSERK